jgi:hypothetical protein
MAIKILGSTIIDDSRNIVNAGIVTATRLVVKPIGSGTTFTENLVVEGSARVTGILSIGTGTIVLDPNDNAIVLADVKIRRDHSTGDVRFLDTGGNLSNIVAKTIRVGSGNSSVSISNDNGNVVFTDSNNSIINNITSSSSGITSTSSINTTGIITANSYYVGNTPVINSAGQWVGSPIYSNIDGGMPNTVYGQMTAIDGGGV